jgi:hypothetical protein
MSFHSRVPPFLLEAVGAHGIAPGGIIRKNAQDHAVRGHYRRKVSRSC